MKRIVITILALLLMMPVLTATDLFPVLRVHASQQQEEAADSIGFYVRAILPENQINDRLSYFDLQMTPSQVQALEIEVVNETNESITVDIDAISASTNRNGVIDYKTPDIRDKTLRYPFSEIADIETQDLTIPANGTGIASIVINMPAEEYDGVILGGLVLTRRTEAEQETGNGMSLQNVYSYVIGVKLSETDVPVEPDFEIESVQGESVNYQASMVHYIRNFTAAIAKDMNIQIAVTDEEGNVVAEIERDGIDMAPNSTMPLAVSLLPDGGESNGSGQTQTPGDLASGDYTSEIKIDHNGQTWDFIHKFTIGSAEADNINNETIGAGPEAGGSFDNLPIILLIIAIAVIAIMFVLLMRRKKQDDENKSTQENGNNR